MSKNDKKLDDKIKRKKSKMCGFTLVELIVVITILAILGSIAFVSFQGYASSARDSTRLSDMRSISKGLALYNAKSGFYPLPENYSTITASGIVIRYQGIAGQSSLIIAGIGGINQGAGKDPKSGEYYTYIVDGDKRQYNLVGYFENIEGVSYNNILPRANASYIGGLMKSIGSNLGIVYESGSTIPIHEKYPSGTTVDIRNTLANYKVTFSFGDEVIGTGQVLYTSFYNRDIYMLTNKDLASLDNSLVLYFDMSTTTKSGTTDLIKDYSKNGYNGYCYNGGTIVNCGDGVPGPIIKDGYMRFDGDDDYVQVNKNVYSNEMTVLIRVKPEAFGNGRYGFMGYQDSTTGLRPFNLRMAPSQYTSGVGGFHYDSQEASATSLSVACNTGKRCADNLTYQYDPNANKVMQFYVAYVRKPPNVRLNINGAPFIDRNCRQQSPTFTDCTFPQVQTFNNFNTNFNYFRLGKTDNYFKGTIDEVRVYNRALSDSEISALYSSIAFNH